MDKTEQAQSAPSSRPTDRIVNVNQTDYQMEDRTGAHLSPLLDDSQAVGKPALPELSGRNAGVHLKQLRKQRYAEHSYGAMKARVVRLICGQAIRLPGSSGGVNGSDQYRTGWNNRPFQQHRLDCGAPICGLHPCAGRDIIQRNIESEGHVVDMAGGKW